MTMESAAEKPLAPIVLRTLHDRVLIERDKAPKKIGLLHIPDTLQEQPNAGKVVAIGNKVFDLKVGDRVRFIKSAGNAVKVDSEELLILTEQDVYGVLEDGGIRPISSKVIIEPDPPDEKIGRIIIPKTLQKERRDRETLVSGKIVAMGPGMKKRGTEVRWPMPDVKIGQRVFYFQNYTPEVIVESKTYVVVADDQLRAAVEEG